PFVTEAIIRTKITPNGKPASKDAAWRLVKPPARIKAMVKKPKSKPHNTFKPTGGLSVDPILIPATMKVAESAEVTRKVNINTIAIIDVNQDIGKVSNKANKACVWSSKTISPILVLFIKSE